ncbi:uncharacterized protein LOC120628284 isoform X1 [Pararge aegeria]|uniref:uncharacterized protein LOC120628284 isoform X1 n=1 Tax=Pararge aegeria TaxID=116150 RepID=UPI0019D254C4|nr:uncharacterized protein LOC120628284 isoform X1 [Pararge aegeria]
MHALNRIETFLDCLIKITKIPIVDANDVSAPKYLVPIVLLCSTLILTTAVLFKENIYGILFAACKTVIFSELLLLELQFSYIAELINTRFQDVNRRLKEIVCQMQQEDNMVPYRRLQVAHKIHKINNSFTTTTNVAKELNDTENSLLFLHIVAFIVQFIISATNLLETSYLRQKITVSSPSSNSRIIYFSCWISYEIVKGLVLIEPSHEHQEQMKLTRILVAEIMTHVTSESDLILDAITNFYKHLLLNNFAYSTMGVFNLERSLICKIVGVVIAVIVLFI